MLFKLGSLKNNTKGKVEVIIERIKNGDEFLRAEFIKDNILYIIKLISNILGIYIDDKNSEEFSIGLSAFNEAIDGYNPDRNDDFFRYSNMVIKHRIIDYLRKNKKHNNVMPFSHIEGSPEFSSDIFISKHNQFEKIEIREELESFEMKMMEFEISLSSLVEDSPKHQDSRLLSIKIARIIAQNDDLYSKMIRKKCIPLSDVLNQIKVNKKTIVRNRKFIIAVCLILRSDLEDLKSFIVNIERREKYE